VCVFLLAATGALAAGCGGSGTQVAGSTIAAGDGSVVELKGVAQLRTQFDQDAGKARLLVLLSPT
jgi:hypothetical protein